MMPKKVWGLLRGIPVSAIIPNKFLDPASFPR
jgi:hypothetical protein